ncbi:hypothetical protein [Sphingobacterium paludis]|uniref:Uncharacterized protein n=1 Tax=Sphingobacterium paludis TaxID=1476465 RepID=A0A4R7D4T3_9SPHI|nr:hypothetical protein [Sphingobacterium paludis]TDS14705.1 hypothetical protein B0I21_103200 [Sphingobacterium paludis]
MNTSFKNCDDFADYIIDSVLNHGDIVTHEFNRMTNLDIPVGRSLNQYVKEKVAGGKNFSEFGTVKAFLYDIYELTLSPIFSLYDKARLAHTWTSMNPDRAARMNINEHIAELNADLNLLPKEDHNWYTDKYIRLYSDWLSAKGRTASSMVTGPANFPVERNRKALNSEHNKYQAFQEWRDKTQNSIQKRIERSKPESQKRDEKFELLKKDIIHSAAVIVDIDNGTEPYNRALFVSSITGKIERLAKNGEKELVEKCLLLLEELNSSQKKPIITSRNSVWNLREVAVDIAKEAERPNEEYQIDGGIVIVNYTDDRIQVKHDEKPSRQVIDSLKRNSFNWSRFNGAWQRKITNNTKNVVNNMFALAIR